MINSINYYFSFGMLALFIDSSPTSSYGLTGNGLWNPTPTQPNNQVYNQLNDSVLNQTSLTFRQGFITYDDVWDVRNFLIFYLFKIFEFHSIFLKVFGWPTIRWSKL